VVEDTDVNTGPDADANEPGHQDASDAGDEAEEAGSEDADVNAGPDADANEPGHQDASDAGDETEGTEAG